MTLNVGCADSDEITHARSAWTTTEKMCGTYHYTLTDASFSGSNWATTIEITDGVATRRALEVWHYGPTDGTSAGPKIIDKMWTETGTSVGTNMTDGAAAPKTMEGLYDDCAHNVLSQDPGQNTIRFAADARGVLNECWYVPNQCYDDCRMGVAVTSFECGPMGTAP
jgi:hypothetical protein